MGLQDNMLHSTAPNSHGSSIATPVTSQAQLVPMVKIAGQGSQPVLVPAYQQQPVMMILANSSTSSPGTNWVTVPSSTANSPAQQQNSTVLNNVKPVQPYRTTSMGAQVKVPETQATYQSDMPPSSSSSSVEDQLRLQIAHLQQQLYQSQLAAARACQKPQLVAVSQADLSPGRLVEPLGSKYTSGGGGVKQMQGTMMVQTPSFHKITLQDQHSPPAVNGSMEHHSPLTMKSLPSPQLPPAPRATHNNSVAMAVGASGVAMETSQPVQQYIPIPVVPTQDAQYLYMSP